MGDGTRSVPATHSHARTRLGTWRKLFLASLGEVPNVTLAARAAGVDRVTVYEHRKKDAAFAARWDQALESAMDLMEAEMHRRGFLGTDKPVYYEGAEVGKVKEYSDTLAIFLAKAHRPEKFRERIHLKSDGAAAGSGIVLVDRAAAEAAIIKLLGEGQPAAPAG